MGVWGASLGRVLATAETVNCYTTISRGIAILPHFLEHAKHLGVNRVFININNGPLNPEYERVSRIYGKHPMVSLYYNGRGLYDTEDDARMLSSLIGMNEERGNWVMVADIDEFPIFEGDSLQGFIEQADRSGVNHLFGELVDRVTQDGSIPKELSRDIWNQFPIRCRLTAALGACSLKVVMMKAGTFIRGGHHHVMIGTGLKCCTVEHFKWHTNVIDRILDRYEIEAARGYPWIKEGRDAINVLASGRLLDSARKCMLPT